jgi:hypothetical protein
MTRRLLQIAKTQMRVFTGLSHCALRRDQVLMYHVLNNSLGVIAPSANRYISFARHLLPGVFHGRPPTQVHAAVDEETKGDVSMDEVEFVSDIATREVRDFVEGPDAAFELVIAEDDDDASEEEQDRIRRFAPVDPSKLPEDVKDNILIKIEGPRKQRCHVVRKVDGSIWRRSSSKDALIEMVISELGVEWREFVQSKY